MSMFLKLFAPVIIRSARRGTEQRKVRLLETTALPLILYCPVVRQMRVLRLGNA